MKINAARQLFFSVMWGLVVVLVGHWNNSRLREWGLSKSTVCHSVRSIFICGYYLQYTNFLSLSNKELNVVIAFIPVHALGNQGEINTFLIVHSTKSVLPEWQRKRKKHFVWISGMAVCQNSEVKMSEVWRKGVLVETVGMIFWKSTEVKPLRNVEWIVVGEDCSCVCMNK